MPKVTKKTIDLLTDLSRIGCTEEERLALQQDLEKVFAHFETLEELDTEGVKPCNHVLEMTNVWREDETGKTLSREEFLDNCPKHTGGMVHVPTVIH